MNEWSQFSFMIDVNFFIPFFCFCFVFKHAGTDLHPKLAVLSKNTRNIKSNAGRTNTRNADDSIDFHDANIFFNATEPDILVRKI